MNQIENECVTIEEERVGRHLLSVITLHGNGYAKTKTLAEFYGVSKSEIEKRLREFRLTHAIEVIEWSQNTQLVNVADFHSAVWAFSKH